MDNDMNPRLTALETRLDTILPTLATKADIANTMTAILDAKTSIVMWMVLVTVSVAALTTGVMMFVINRALPVQPAPAPQVIIVPQQSAPQK